jgi:phosphoribosyl-ATP pyrophosphohydrolase
LNKVLGKPLKAFQPAVASDLFLDEGEIERLFEALGRANLPPRTRKLSAATIIKKAKKLVEEASEMSFEAVFGRKRGVVEESVDLIYHMVVLWRACGVKPNEIWKEMSQRAAQLGVAEKLPKRGKGKSGRGRHA